MQAPELSAPGLDVARTRATLIGATAVLMWSSLAPLTVVANAIGPLELLGLTFGIAFASGLIGILARSGSAGLARLKQPVGYFALSLTALFGYHALYFTALSLAPPAQASLVAYLWPLLIVLFSASGAQGERIRAAHIFGAVLGLAGTTLIFLSREGSNVPAPNKLLGLLAAVGCAVTWSGYSVLNRRFSNVSSEAIVLVCAFVSILGWAAHWLIQEPTIWPGASQWVAITALGVGPVGLAFLAWDYGTKRGHLGLLGAISYIAPVLSTLLLVIFGRASLNINLIASCALVVTGAWMATTASRPELR